MNRGSGPGPGNGPTDNNNRHSQEVKPAHIYTDWSISECSSFLANFYAALYSELGQVPEFSEDIQYGHQQFYDERKIFNSLPVYDTVKTKVKGYLPAELFNLAVEPHYSSASRVNLVISLTFPELINTEQITSIDIEDLQNSLVGAITFAARNNGVSIAEKLAQELVKNHSTLAFTASLSRDDLNGISVDHEAIRQNQIANRLAGSVAPEKGFQALEAESGALESLVAPQVHQTGRILDPGITSPTMAILKSSLEHEVIGQPQAIERICEALLRSLADIKDPNRPIATLLLPGPTGTGKTETARAIAKTLFGNPDALTRISGQEFKAHYNLSKLLGSPPGYVGGEIRPLLSQENLDRHFKEAMNERRGMIGQQTGEFARFGTAAENPVNVVLFDELEKAHPALWNLLLGITEDGEVTLAQNEIADFRNSIILVTTNAGSSSLSGALSGEGVAGFKPFDESREINYESVMMRGVRRAFPPEFLNRFDAIVPFMPLSEKDVLQIAVKMTDKVQERILATETPFKIKFSDDALRALAEKGFDRAYGARPLRRVIENEIVTPLSSLVTSRQIEAFDLIVVDHENSGFTFRSLGRIPEGDELADFQQQLEVVLSSGSLSHSDITFTRNDSGAKEKLGRGSNML
ncbi:MAG: ATP-dependent Clp protease ATP-binding subunit [Candidatus Dadabacteria bacterium]|nr:MAG: ATP-dependent Clp protease ATP-binding subunit [Candidatus Dadabacteria bacterium]